MTCTLESEMYKNFFFSAQNVCLRVRCTKTALYSTKCKLSWYKAVFVHLTLKFTLCAVKANFCAYHSQTYKKKAVFAHLTLKRKFCTENTVFVHLTFRCTFCAAYGSFCTSHSQAYILCGKKKFLYISLSSVHLCCT